MNRRFPEERAEAFVVAGALQVIAAAVPPTARDDLLCSSLLAQLVADKDIGRTEKPVEWCHRYSEVMQKVGWQIGALDFRKTRPRGGRFSVGTMAIQLLEKEISKADLASLAEAIKRFQSLPVEHAAVRLLDERACSPRAVAVQIRVSTPSGTHAVMIAFRTKRAIHTVFRGTLAIGDLEGGQAETLVQRTTLNEDIYAQVRDMVIEKLGVERGRKISKLDIA